VNTTTRACVLCGGSATVTDWAPVAAWLAVEGCQCGGFLVWTPVWDSRLTDMSDMERRDLSERIRAARACGSEAWVGPTDGQVTGPLVISQSRPRRPPQPAPRTPNANRSLSGRPVDRPAKAVFPRMDPIGHSVPSGDINRLRWIVLRDLRKGERELAKMQQVEPDPERARHLSAVRAAIAELETFVAPLPEN